MSLAQKQKVASFLTEAKHETQYGNAFMLLISFFLMSFFLPAGLDLSWNIDLHRHFSSLFVSISLKENSGYSLENTSFFNRKGEEIEFKDMLELGEFFKWCWSKLEL